MKTYLLLPFLFAFIFLKAQTASDENNSSIHFNFGRSFNGTGDISGFQYGFTYARLLGKKTYWSIGFEGTLHDGEIINYVYDEGKGDTFVGKSRFVTGGIQLVGCFGYDFIKNSSHAFGLSIGPIVRYQSSSIPNVISILYPAITDLPMPVENVQFTESFRIISLGVVLKLNYYYTFRNNYIVGLTGGFQTDTNGDSISYLSLGFGKRF